MSPKEPTIATILLELSEQYDGAVPEREVFDRVLARRPSTAKDPYARIREQLRFHSAHVGWVGLGNGQVMPLRVALLGLRFRITPTADEIDRALLLRDTLRPFVDFQLKIAELHIEDAQGQPLSIRDTSLQASDVLFGTIMNHAIDLGIWYQRVGFTPGDSILVTITGYQPLALHLEYEPADRFDQAAVAEQDRELLEGIVARVARNSRSSFMPEDVVLPIFARAAWRTGYPGTAWQRLVQQERRLRLLEGGMISDSSFRRPLDLLMGNERDAEFWEENDSAILSAINMLQESLRDSRREAAERGIWNGIAPRVSTARTIFDIHQGTAETHYPGAVNALEDHSADIEEHIARGDYANADWNEDEDDDIDGLMFDDDFEMEDDELLDIDEIEDLQAFVEQNPALGEATRRLMESLSPEELERLQNAETLEDVQGVLGNRLTELLRTEPSLFVPLEPPALGSANGNGHANGDGNGHSNGSLSSFDEEFVEADELLESDDLEEEDEEEDEEEQVQVEMALERSNELMDRFYQHQIGNGKSETTAASRTRDLWIYADFLGNYYGRSLDAGDYATLDECLFYFYPRKVLNSSARAVREICTSVKQFYAFLKAEKLIADDGFAVAIWQRRNQAARVVELYEQIDSDSPQFERLFAHLFAPYTA
ncbi:MAG: hypothetical protein OHK0022_01580 [Roseiflexaceae bacterium]